MIASTYQSFKRQLSAIEKIWVLANCQTRRASWKRQFKQSCQKRSSTGERETMADRDGSEGLSPTTSKPYGPWSLCLRGQDNITCLAYLRDAMRTKHVHENWI